MQTEVENSVEANRNPGLVQSPLTEQIHFAGFWIRFCAMWVDHLVVALMAWLVVFLMLGTAYWGSALMGHASLSFDSVSSVALQVAVTLASMIVSCAYYVFGTAKYGTTLGKKVFRIYVVDYQTRAQVTLGQSLVRYLGYIVSYLTLWIGYVIAAFHPEKRALHDLIAGTMCIRKDHIVTAQVAENS